MPDKEADSRPEAENEPAERPESFHIGKRGGDVLIPEVPLPSKPGRLDGAPAPAAPADSTPPADGMDGGSGGDS